MKICLLNDAFPPVIDGVANTVKNYADYLNEESDTSAFVVTPFYPDGNYSSYPYDVITYDSVDTSALAAGYRAGYPMPVKELGLIAEKKPDLIHVHCPFTSCLIGRSLREMSDAPMILTWHTKYDIDIRNVIALKPLQDESIRLLIHNVSACDEVWTVSKGAGENLKSLGYEGNYKVVHNGVDFEKGRANEKSMLTHLKDYDLPADIPVLLYTGRMMNYKNLPLILSALKKLSEAGMDYRMIMAGGGKDLESLIQTVRNYGISCDDYHNEEAQFTKTDLPGKVIFLGPVRDREILRCLNTRADLFLFPSTFDTNGLVVREAAACGLASVLVKDSCAAEGVTDMRSGYLIEESDEALFAFLKENINNREQLKQAGEHAMNELYLSWKDAVHIARGHYENLLERKKSGLLTRPKQFDDPLFEMSAEAARRYLEVSANEFAFYEGMMDNFDTHARKILDRAENRLQKISDRVNRIFDTEDQ